MSLVELQYAEVPLTIGGIGEDSRLLTKQAPRVNTTIEPVLIMCTDIRIQHNSVTYIISVSTVHPPRQLYQTGTNNYLLLFPIHHG